jgi:hypothetical protein
VSVIGKMILDERTAVIAHIERKVAAAGKMADAGRVRRDFADELARVLTELVGDLRNEFHMTEEVGVVADLVNEEATDGANDSSKENRDRSGDAGD